MQINVPGLEVGCYAEMTRENGIWVVSVNDELVAQIKDQKKLSALGRDFYRLIGVAPGCGRVIRFADLHRHSEYSLLDGMTKIHEMVSRTEYSGALTDHGVMYGFLDYYKSMKKAGKHPIIGFEAYMEGMDGQLKGHHVVLLAKDNTGVKNLFKLTSDGYSNFRRKPHVTWEMLREYREGIICLSGCLAGVIPCALVKGDLPAARAAMEKFISIYGREDFYVEIQRHHIREEDVVRDQLVQLAGEYGVKVVATTDSHYADKEDSYPHEVLLCLQTDKTISDPNHMTFDGTGYHLMTSEEMEDLFRAYPDALDNTLEIAERCQVELSLGEVNLPNYVIPKKFSTPMDYLLHLAEKGYRERFGGTAHENDPVYRERFQYEVKMLEKMGFASYFIIVWDFVDYCHRNNIYVGPGRGSAAGSIVAFCLGITDLDPIKYNLLFERFLNPERVSWPDIDTDIEFSRRPEVIQYMTKKYGAENVCRIVTFGTLAAKQAVRDVARCLGHPASYGAKLSGLIPKGPGVTIGYALDTCPDFRAAYDSDKDARQIIDIACRLEGNRRHASQHACGLAIAPAPVSEFLPTSMEINMETREKALTSQVVMTEVEELSLIKMDLLGLKNMGVIHEVIDRVVEEYGTEAILKKLGSPRKEVRYQDIPLDDRSTYQMLAKGITGGVFQLESEGMTKVVVQMLSDIDSLPESRMHECFERLIAAVALYRPGPMDYIPNYIAGMRDIHNIHYLTPELEPILRPTYGVIVFQEQVMQIVQKLAGYTLGRADLVRKAMGKKKQDVMDAERQVFIYGNKDAFETGKDKNYAPGCIANGIPENIAQEIWEQMANFAKYAFNRSHAACYAWIACITAYMSCHWPNEFYAALLNAFIDNSDKVRAYLSQAAHRDIHLLLPDVNASSCLFRAEEGGIRFGLQGISGLKSQAVGIVSEREAHGLYEDFQDLYDRMADRGEKLNKKAVEGLVWGGALNALPKTENKAALIAMFPSLESSYKKMESSRKMGQLSFFSAEEAKVPVPSVPPLDDRELLDKEGKTLGMFLSGHPADRVLRFAGDIQSYISVDDLCGEQAADLLDCPVSTLGMIRDLRQFYTKKGEGMCTFNLETRFSAIPCVVFPSTYKQVFAHLQDSAVVALHGKMTTDYNRDRNQFVVEGIDDEESLSETLRTCDIHVRSKAEQEYVLAFAKKHPGNTRLVLIDPAQRSWPTLYRVDDASPAFIEMRRTLGLPGLA